MKIRIGTKLKLQTQSESLINNTRSLVPQDPAVLKHDKLCTKLQSAPLLSLKLAPNISTAIFCVAAVQRYQTQGHITQTFAPPL